MVRKWARGVSIQTQSRCRYKIGASHWLGVNSASSQMEFRAHREKDAAAQKRNGNQWTCCTTTSKSVYLIEARLIIRSLARAFVTDSISSGTTRQRASAFVNIGKEKFRSVREHTRKLLSALLFAQSTSF